MGRITSTTELIAADLTDWEPYTVTLDGWWIVAGQWGDQLQISLQLESGETVRDWLGLRLGTSNDTGKVSKLRQFLNALSGRPENAPVWFTYPDAEHPDVPYEWGYEGETRPAGVFTQGLPIVVRGKTTQNAQGQERFSVQVYQAAGQRQAPEMQQPAKRRPAVVSEEAPGRDDPDNDVPF